MQSTGMHQLQTSTSLDHQDAQVSSITCGKMPFVSASPACLSSAWTSMYCRHHTLPYCKLGPQDLSRPSGSAQVLRRLAGRSQTSGTLYSRFSCMLPLRLLSKKLTHTSHSCHSSSASSCCSSPSSESAAAAAAAARRFATTPAASPCCCR